MLEHLMLYASVSSCIDPIVIDAQLLSHSFDVGAVFEIIAKLIMQKCTALEKHLLFEGIISEDGLYFMLFQWFPEHIGIDDPDAFPAFFYREILSLESKNIVEETLIPSGSGIHGQEFLFGFGRKQPLWELIIFRIRILIIEDLPLDTIVLQHRIAVLTSELDICLKATGQRSPCLAALYIIVPGIRNIPEEEMHSP